MKNLENPKNPKKYSRGGLGGSRDPYTDFGTDLPPIEHLKCVKNRAWLKGRHDKKIEIAKN